MREQRGEKRKVRLGKNSEVKENGKKAISAHG
jgi:hypothetical protein